MRHSLLFLGFVLLAASACTSGGGRRPARDAGPRVDTGMGDMDSGGGTAHCSNGMRDGDETAVDCGGSCDPCPDGSGCARPTDCVSMVCVGGFCLMPSCMDGILNQDETDVDCGGATCPGCDAGAVCTLDTDCASGLCDAGTCASTSCTDGVQNSDETDIDCGGSCPGCPGDGVCNLDEDCASLICVDRRCTTATCDDRVQNGDETDEDCGGSCPGCRDASMCLVNEDCESMQCQAGNCISCVDGRQNGEESDVDCGGTLCAGCADGFNCMTAMDCTSGICTAGVCEPPGCTDMILNADETDVDCGGATCPGCATGEMCSVGSDCADGVCTGGACAAPSCSDMILNGDETDVDCGGPTCTTRCADFRRCSVAGDCATGACTMGFCGSTGCMPFPGTSTDAFGYFGCSLPLTPATLPCPDIATSGTTISLSDDSQSTVPIGFSFSFYGTSYTNASVSSNGTLAFAAFSSLSNVCPLPGTSTSPDRYIAPYWDDLYPPGGGSVRYQTLGSAPNRQFVVRWEVDRYPGTPNTATFIVVLNETSNDVQVCYPDTAFGSATYDRGLSATSGIRGPSSSGLTGLQFSCNTASLTDGLYLQYLHP